MSMVTGRKRWVALVSALTHPTLATLATLAVAVFASD